MRYEAALMAGDPYAYHHGGLAGDYAGSDDSYEPDYYDEWVRPAGAGLVCARCTPGRCARCPALGSDAPHWLPATLPAGIWRGVV